MSGVPRLEYDRSVDAIYVYLRDVPQAFTDVIDTDRAVDYGSDDQPIGVELLNVSLGVSLEDLPERETLERLLEEHEIRILKRAS